MVASWCSHTVSIPPPSNNPDDHGNTESPPPTISHPLCYQRNYKNVSAILNNAGVMLLDYRKKGKIYLQLMSVQPFDKDGTALHPLTDLTDEKLDLILPKVRFRDSTATTEELLEIIGKSAKDEGVQEMLDQIPKADLTTTSEQMPIMSRSFACGPLKGKVEFESFIVTELGAVGVTDEHMPVADGDFKFGFKVEWDDYEQAKDVHSVDVVLRAATDTALMHTENHFYKIVGLKNMIYMPNKYHAWDEKTKKAKMHTMDDPYPTLTDLDQEGNQYFTLRFRNARKMFYDQSESKEPLPEKKQDGDSNPDHEETAKFKKTDVFARDFTLKELDESSVIEGWLKEVLPGNGEGATKALTTLTSKIQGLNDVSQYVAAGWYEEYFVAMKSERKVIQNKSRGIRKLLFGKKDKVICRVDLKIVHPENKKAKEELNVVQLNIETSWEDI